MSAPNYFLVDQAQRIGMGTLSVRSALERDSVVDNPQREQDRLVSEAIQRSLLHSLETPTTEDVRTQTIAAIKAASVVAPSPQADPEPTGRNYNLRYAKCQQFYGFDTPGQALRAFADFNDENEDRAISVSLAWSSDEGGAEGAGSWGGTVTWEDI